MKSKIKLLLICLLAMCLTFSVACMNSNNSSGSESVELSETTSEEQSLEESEEQSEEQSEEESESEEQSEEESESEEQSEEESESEEQSEEESESEEQSEEESESEEQSEEESESEEESQPVDTYSIVFVDFDDSVISSAEYELGATVEVPADPTREADETYTYEFAGWDNEVVAVEGSATYKATYTATYIDYTVTFVDEHGETISSETYHYGDEVEVPEFPEVEPNNMGYPVYSWDKEVVAVDGNETYTRVVDFVYFEYVITFVNEDGTVLSEATYHYGDEVEVPADPTKEADETYTYEFAGWDSEVVTVVNDATYTATYNPVYIDYTVRFLDEDGTVLSEATYHYGDDVAEYVEPLVKDADEYFTYEFAGWNREITSVDGHADYVAVYTSTAKDGYTSAGVSMQNSALVLGAGRIGDGANYTVGQNNGGYVDQAYFAIDGEFGLNSFVAFDFTGKNMPEVAFFANNYDNSMYADGTSKQGIVVYSGITTYNGEDAAINQTKENGTYINYSFPHMIADAANGGFVSGSFKDSALGRANLVDGKHYRVVMGFVAGGHEGLASGITLKWYLYDLDEGVVVEESTMGSWGFFTGSNDAVNNMTLNDLVGSVVLYGKFGATTTIDKLHGVFSADYDVVKEGVGQTFTVTFTDANGEEIERLDNVKFGETVSFDGEMPELDVTEDDYFTYSIAGWDKAFAPIVANTEYNLVVASTLKEDAPAYNVTSNGTNVVLGSGRIGDGANYTIGQNNGGYVDQAYYAIDGEFGLDSYVAFDFTGKNMPEVAFFANNYDNSMYANGTSKQGIVVVTGVTTWDGGLGSNVQSNGTKINYAFPYMVQDANDGGFTRSNPESALARANLVDGKHYRVIMGFTRYQENGGIQLNWYLYDLDTNAMVEQNSVASWNFFTGSNAQVGNMTLNDLVGSVVLYGKFGTTCTLDKVHGVFENSTIDGIIAGLNGATYTVTFKDAEGNVLETLEDVAFGSTVSYNGTMPTPPAGNALMDYSYAWDKSFAPISADTVYTLTLVSTAKQGYRVNNATAQGDAIILGSGSIGDGANYTKGQNNGGHVRQAYLGIDGNYGLNNYIVFDFTGKNLPEVAFFANNYNDSMYAEGTNKTGIVVVTGVTTWDGQLSSGVNGNGTQINYGFPYMIQDAASGAFCQSALKSSALGRANLVDGTHYRVIMGFTGSGNAITLNWCLYNLDTDEVVEQSSMTTWNFFTGDNEAVGNMTINDLSGSIVLYGKFGATCTIDKLYGVEAGAFEDVVASYTA